MENEYYKALGECSTRYRVMATVYVRHPNLRPVDKDFISFLDLFHKSVQDRLPLMKLNRWLGYIQGTLISRGYTTVEAERDWTRPLFRPLDFNSVD